MQWRAFLVLLPTHETTPRQLLNTTRTIAARLDVEQLDTRLFLRGLPLAALFFEGEPAALNALEAGLEARGYRVCAATVLEDDEAKVNVH